LLLLVVYATVFAIIVVQFAISMTVMAASAVSLHHATAVPKLCIIKV